MNRGRVGHVSWLEAASFSFPEPKLQWMSPNERSGIAPGPLTVAGPRRHRTGFRYGPPASDCARRDSRIGCLRQAREVPVAVAGDLGRNQDVVDDVLDRVSNFTDRFFGEGMRDLSTSFSKLAQTTFERP